MEGYTCLHEDTVHLETRKIAPRSLLWFSCPGRLEASASPPGPAKGQTGANLADLVSLLELDQQLPFLRRGQARITNAWAHVEYRDPNGNGRSEARYWEVLAETNLDRLHEELDDIDLAVVCCGNRAAMAVLSRLPNDVGSETESGWQYCHHLGNIALNKLDFEGTNAIGSSLGQANENSKVCGPPQASISTRPSRGTLASAGSRTPSSSVRWRLD